jgi:hypothetical protein
MKLTEINNNGTPSIRPHIPRWEGAWHDRGYLDSTIYNRKRVLMPSEVHRLEYIINWVKRNVK